MSPAGSTGPDGTPGTGRARPVHQSLIQVPTFAGVDRSFLVLEATLGMAVAVGMGVSWVTLIVVGLIVAVVHPVLVSLTKRDPMMTSIAARALGQSSVYDPLGSASKPGRRAPRAVPKL
ncbi:VirB3 family type IV secretion system protein [Rubrivirga litoralis]|uniref:VirB3 family type IV secretion system protein n=1 Tax=Rubrivirga litoralis TaxID=3075598 RepID=A0ABU3BUI2_9BACT|nr:VirB3 family type IV secretion system protein [Rubrivirga sp. F394]MDT0632951.1 VirB3 family type IV secretion system protein [Rubrivirga sp. F394]